MMDGIEYKVGSGLAGVILIHAVLVLRVML